MPRLAVAWALMSGAVAGWYLLGGLTLMKRRGRWHREVVGDIAILVSRETGPAVFGLLRPAIVVPRWTLAMRTQALAFILRHEEEHIAARDRTGLRRARPLLAQGRRQPSDLLRGTAWGCRPVIAHAALLPGDVRFIVVASDED